MISVAEVTVVATTGEVIRQYPDDKPFASCLALGRVASRVLHVVYADDTAADRRIVITTYEPDPALWDADFKTKVKP